MADKLEIMKKSYVSSPQDEWVNGNMKNILDWAKKYNNAQYNNIKTAFSNYRKASGLNSKVKAFQEIQNSLVNKDGVPLFEKMKSWYDEFEPKIRENADLYHDGDVDKVSLKPETKQMKEIWDAIRPSLSSIPKNEENDSDLDVGDIYKENYNQKTKTFEKDCLKVEDKWIICKLNKTIKDVTKNIENYEGKS